MGVSLLLRKLTREMTFNIFTTERVSCFGQYDRIDDLITCSLRGDKCCVLRQYLIDVFHFSAVFKCFDPLFVWHFRISSREISVCREYTLFGARNRRWGTDGRLVGIRHSQWRTKNYNGELPSRRVFTRTNKFLNDLTEGWEERS